MSSYYSATSTCFSRDAKQIILALMGFDTPVGVDAFHKKVGLSKSRIATLIAPRMIENNVVFNGYKLCRAKKGMSRAYVYWVEEVS